MRSAGNAGVVDSLRVGEFRALWSAETVSVLGDQLARVALAILVYDRTSSATLTALTYALTFVPAVVGGWLLSGLADRYPRKQVIVITDLLRAALALSMAIPGMPLPVLWGLISLLTMASAPFKAAQLALLPQILVGDRYQAGLAVRQMSVQVAQVAGFGSGGLIVSALRPSGALVLDAVTFVASAVIVAVGVRARPVATDDETGSGSAPRAARQFDPRLLAPFALGGLVGLLVVPEGLAAPYAGAIGVGSLGVGLLMAADPVGSVLGAWWTARAGGLAVHSQRSVIVPAALAGIPLAACSIAPGLVGPILLWAVSGALSTVYLIRLQPMIVAIVPNSRRGAVMGRYSTTVYAGQGIAIFAGGLLAEHAGPVATVAISGALTTVLVLALAAAWRFARPRQARTAEDEPGAPGRATRKPSDLFVTHSGLLPGRPGAGGGNDSEAATSEPGPSSGNGSEISMPAASRSTQPGTPVGPTGWAAWSHSVPARVFVLMVELAAVAVVGISAIVVRPAGRAFVLCAVVVGFGLVAAELARQVERRRRRFSDTPHVNFSSVWTLAGALVLPPALAAVLAVTLYAHLWFRCSRGVDGAYLSRFLFNASNVILSCQVAAWTATELQLAPMTHQFGLRDAISAVVVIAVYYTMNSTIAAALIAIVRPDRTARRLLGPLSENVLELATLCMGLLTALLLSLHPALVVLMLVPLYALHRSVLIRQFEHAATTDSKTGLLNSTAWHALAEAEFGRARRTGSRVGIMMVDLDHFRRINNTFGHLAGDKVLRAVGQALQEIVGGDDRCGRFGGEEFVVMLPGASHDELEEVANRICQAIFRTRVDAVHDAGVGHQLSASVGAAMYPTAGASLEEVLLAADLALFAAKDAGRNQVRVIETTS
ncbi:MFS transporter [Amycolatopsis sp. H20-H5]|uniref:MFS transporter n=1 Tax=Amycolatopsis sp. H20-H5 TaxID=3046309 RepID=UPI002DB94E8E|nr:MFS transporter [Amycolatopsis sp. H20-H5]MEC3974310.1 MFS transporter [Amycolatopsis sp. H20-H5]